MILAGKPVIRLSKRDIKDEVVAAQTVKQASGTARLLSPRSTGGWINKKQYSIYGGNLNKKETSRS